MATFVEISDLGAARAAGNALSDAGEQVGQDDRCAPEVDFGEDEFGAAMRSRYPSAVAAMCGVNKTRLARSMSDAGAAVASAIDQHATQDWEDAQRFYGL